jgi:hypothetical protein
MGKPENHVIALRGGAIEWTRLRQGREGCEIEASGKDPLPGDEDPLRTLSHPSPELTAALDAAAKSAGGRHATFVLPGSGAIQRIVILPATDPRELAGMVDLQIDALSPFPPETVGHSFEILETGETAARVLIAIVQKSILETVGTAFHRRGLIINRITLSTLGWWGILKRKQDLRAPGRRVMLIAEKQSCELLVADAGVPVLFRSHALLEGLSAEEFAQDIAQETASAMTALELEHGGDAIANFTVWMAADAPATLKSALAEAGGWSVHTEPLDSLGSLSEGVAQREPAKTELDLVPESWRLEEKNRLIKKGLATASAVALGLWVLVVAGVLAWQDYQGRALRRVEANLEAVKPAAQDVRDSRRRVQALSVFGDITRSAIECLRELISLMPAGVELNQITFEKGKAIALSGEAPTSQAIYDFKKALDGSTLFSGTELQGPVRSKNRETFRIAISIQEAGE